MNILCKNTIKLKFKALILFTAIIVLCVNIYGQSITWQKVLNNNYGVLKRVIQTSDGGFCGIGTDRINNADKMYLVKLDNFGNVLWTKIIGVGNAEGYWLEQTTDNGLIIGGSIDSGLVDDKAYLVKTDAQGNIQWHKTYSNSGLDQCYCVKQLSDGGYILSCRTTQSTADMFMFIKTDSNGSLIWKKIYGSGTITLSIKEIQILNNGYIAAGGLGLQNSADAYLIKLDQNGDTLWSKKYGGNKADAFYSVDKIGSEGFILGGISLSFNINNRSDSYVIKTDTNGNQIWYKTFNGYDYDICESVRYKPGLGFILAGYSDSIVGNDIKAKVRIINDSGLLLKEVSYLPNITNCSLAVFNSAEITSDGGFIFGGYNEINTFLSMYVVKTDSLLFSNPLGIISSHSNIPENFILHQNYPNPFNPVTNITFEVPKTSNIRIILYNILGMEVKKLVNSNLRSGVYNLKLESGGLASGIYFVSMFAENNYINTQKIILIK